MPRLNGPMSGSFASESAVMNTGRIVQVGSPEDVYAHPASRFVAEFLGLKNILQGQLRQRGADLEGPAWTPLIYAAAGGNEAMIVYLLAEGANINAGSPNGTTALMMAIREGKVPAASLLLARGADVNKRNQNGATALSWALRGNEKALAEALRRAGATE